MSDLIERDKAIKAFAEYEKRTTPRWSMAWNEDWEKVATDVMSAIPSARPKGEWIDRSDGGRILHPWWESYECNQCGYEGSGAWNFCPNCGSDNREREGE